MLNPLGSKFEQDEEWCAALYISTRKLLQRSINKILVGSSGLEPPTSRLSGVRSNHLSYEPLKVVEISGIEPLTSCVQGRRSPS